MTQKQIFSKLFQDSEIQGFILRALLLSSPKYRHLLLLLNCLGLDKTLQIMRTLGGSRIWLPENKTVGTCFLYDSDHTRSFP